MSSSSKPRPKPWETHAPLNADPSTATSALAPSTTNPASAATSANGSTVPSAAATSIPDLPSRPTGLNSENTTNLRGSYGGANSLYGGYGGISGGSPYGSSMYGGYGSGLYGGGTGGMYGSSLYGGSMYGGYGGSGMYGGGGMYGGMNPNGQQGFAESTQATFQLIESLIGAVAGFAQMLEATYMATHNSFFTMVSVAEQVSYLKEMLGSFFGIFALMRLLKRVLYKVTGGRMGIAKRSLQNGKSAIHGKNNLLEEFDKFKESGGKSEKRGKRMSWKPLLIFLAAVFGFPYLLNKFISRLAHIQQRRVGASSSSLRTSPDPKNLEFARAVYDFTPENPQIEVTLKKGDLMAIISKQDPMGNESQWWKVRTKKGDIGYVPYNYIEVIKRQKKIETVINEESQAEMEQDSA